MVTRVIFLKIATLKSTSLSVGDNYEDKSIGLRMNEHFLFFLPLNNFVFRGTASYCWCTSIYLFHCICRDLIESLKGSNENFNGEKRLCVRTWRYLHSKLGCSNFVTVGPQLKKLRVISEVIQTQKIPNRSWDPWRTSWWIV